SGWKTLPMGKGKTGEGVFLWERNPSIVDDPRKSPPPAFSWIQAGSVGCLGTAGTACADTSQPHGPFIDSFPPSPSWWRRSPRCRHVRLPWRRPTEKPTHHICRNEIGTLLRGATCVRIAASLCPEYARIPDELSGPLLT